MNYFKFHLGDYSAATQHLSWDEDQAYMRLLRIYYREEQPLPGDVSKIYRLCRAQTRAQKAAIDTILGEFFSQESDGFHNKRADEELSADRAFLAKQRANGQASASKRWGNQTHAKPITVGQPETSGGVTGTQEVVQPPTPTPTPTPRERGETAVNGRALSLESASRKAPPDFKPDAQFALTELPDVDVDTEAAQFRDTEFDKPRTDWSAEWRKWIRRAKQSGRYAKNPSEAIPWR